MRARDPEYVAGENENTGRVLLVLNVKRFIVMHII